MPFQMGDGDSFWQILVAPPPPGVAALEHKQALVAAVLDAIAALGADCTQPSTACDRGFAYLRAALRERPGTDALRTPRALRLCLKWAARWDGAASADAPIIADFIGIGIFNANGRMRRRAALRFGPVPINDLGRAAIDD